MKSVKSMIWVQIPTLVIWRQVSHPVWDRVKREIYMPVWSVSNNVLVALKQDITSGS